jgi:hypothetical protein
MEKFSSSKPLLGYSYQSIYYFLIARFLYHHGIPDHLLWLPARCVSPPAARIVSSYYPQYINHVTARPLSVKVNDASRLPTRCCDHVVMGATAFTCAFPAWSYGNPFYIRIATTLFPTRSLHTVRMRNGVNTLHPHGTSLKQFRRSCRLNTHAEFG